MEGKGIISADYLHLLWKTLIMARIMGYIMNSAFSALIQFCLCMLLCHIMLLNDLKTF